MVRDEDWDLVIVEISLPGRSGLDLLHELRRRRPKLPLLVLSAHPEDELGLRAIRAGASGYLTKSRAAAELVKAIRLVLIGHKYISRSLADALIDELQHGSDSVPHRRLSDREYDVLRSMASGHSAAQIAAALSVSRSTVGTYRRRILGKLRLRSNAELTRYAVERGLVE
jgi:DNA-binding NarL/FixJ family response regulator